jgi:hypothetical protein
MAALSGQFGQNPGRTSYFRFASSGQQDKIVVRFALTIYPYSFSLGDATFQESPNKRGRTINQLAITNAANVV